MAALFQADEPEYGFFDGFANGEEAVVLQEGGFFGGEARGDGVAFDFGENNAVEGGVESVVLRGGGGGSVSQGFLDKEGRRLKWKFGCLGGGGLTL